MNFTEKAASHAIHVENAVIVSLDHTEKKQLIK